MAFKINIKPDLEEEMERLLNKTSFRSKTDYINYAIQELNQKIKRQIEVEKLTSYFHSKEYIKNSQEINHEFAQLKR